MSYNQYKSQHDYADQQRQGMQAERAGHEAAARTAFNSRNQYAAANGVGFDHNGHMSLSSPWSQYASPNETANVANIMSQKEGDFQGHLAAYGDAQGRIAEQDNLKQQNYDKMNNERDYALSGQAQANQHAQEMAKMRMLSGGFGQSLTAPGTMPTPNVRLFDNGGNRIGGSFLNGLYS